MGHVTPDPDRPTSSTERATARLAAAARARSRAEQRLAAAAVLLDRAAVAHRSAREASARVTGNRPREADPAGQPRSVSPGDTPYAAR